MVAIPEINVPNADAPDVLAGLEAQFKSAAINRFHGGLPAGYEAQTAAQRARDCLRIVCIQAAARTRRQAAEAAIVVSEPVVT